MDFEIIGMENSKQRDLLIEASRYFCYHLIPKQFSDDAYKISLMFYDKLSPYTIAETRWSDCGVEPKHCCIEIKYTKNNFKLLSIVAHELTHVKQIFNKELIDIIESKTDYFWKEKRFNILTEDYWLSPWEIEAYGYETVLVKKFKEFYQLSIDDINKNVDNGLTKIKLINEKTKIFDC